MKLHMRELEVVEVVADDEDMLDEWYAEDNGRRERLAEGELSEELAAARVG